MPKSKNISKTSKKKLLREIRTYNKKKIKTIDNINDLERNIIQENIKNKLKDKEKQRLTNIKRQIKLLSQINNQTNNKIINNINDLERNIIQENIKNKLKDKEKERLTNLKKYYLREQLKNLIINNGTFRRGKNIKFTTSSEITINNMIVYLDTIIKELIDGIECKYKYKLSRIINNEDEAIEMTINTTLNSIYETLNFTNLNEFYVNLSLFFNNRKPININFKVKLNDSFIQNLRNIIETTLLGYDGYYGNLHTIYVSIMF